MKKTLSIHMIWPINAIFPCGHATQMDMPVNPLLLSNTANRRHTAVQWFGNENIIKNLDLDFG